MRSGVVWPMIIGAVAVAAPTAAIAAPSTYAQGALESIDACIKRLDAQADTGYERVAARCPDLTRRLEASSWSAWLPQEWKVPDNDLSAAGLRELRVQVVRELAARPAPQTPDPARLKPILAELGLRDRETGWWARFTQWLEEVFDREPTAKEGWFDHMVSRLGPSQAVLEVISYACLALVVLLATAIVAYELYLAGIFRALRTGKWVQASQPPAAASTGLGWAEIQSAPVGERPGLLLELIAARLAEQHRLPAAGGLTARELTLAARLAAGEDRELLADVAFMAERVRFSAEHVAIGTIEVVLERGRTLLEHIQAVDAAARPAAPGT